MLRRSFALESQIFVKGIELSHSMLRVLSFKFVFLVVLVRCLEKTSLLSKVIPSTFSSLLFLIEMFLDTRSVWSSSLTSNSINEHLLGLRAIKFLWNQFDKRAKSWFSEVIILFIFFSHEFIVLYILNVICKVALSKKTEEINKIIEK